MVTTGADFVLWGAIALFRVHLMPFPLNGFFRPLVVTPIIQHIFGNVFPFALLVVFTRKSECPFLAVSQ